VNYEVTTNFFAATKKKLKLISSLLPQTSFKDSVEIISLYILKVNSKISPILKALMAVC